MMKGTISEMRAKLLRLPKVSERRRGIRKAKNADVMNTARNGEATAEIGAVRLLRGEGCSAVVQES
jgi:hypothetical protein